jgi:hypothetical protein
MEKKTYTIQSINFTESAELKLEVIGLAIKFHKPNARAEITIDNIPKQVILTTSNTKLVKALYESSNYIVSLQLPR